ncbi:Uncharacterised protein [Pseudomonas fluorescens]|uniref:HEPN AbiU2-like domain-containing protein n=1 Tax=Pseudomonas fluorescens TaxID=294 RepID=A0A448DMZ0_PSEFL|nr:hypothetical protein [Pseudomonas fluorescens]VEF08169.1 Uncharacterised protein [Pseudomonas fluorescens]
MTPENDANNIKWLMTDLMVDLASAVGMARDVIISHDPLVPIKSMGRLRVCNHFIVLTLFKLHEVRKGYGQFFHRLPSEATVSLYQAAKDIEAKQICQFRNKYAAHIFDKDSKNPISLKKAEELLLSITGKDNSDCLSFYDWICPVGWKADQKCVVSTVVAMRDYCMGLPGGELERP